MRGTFSIILILLCLCGLLGPVAVRAQRPAPDVKIQTQDGGGYLVTTPSYTARIGADGNLHSLQVKGVEFLDDLVTGSAGASFIVDRPITLPKITQDGLTISATDDTYAIRYDFDEGFLTLTLRHSNPHGAAYAAICTPRASFVENLDQASTAATPADYNWPNAKVSIPTGEYLEFHGGSRIWGRSIGRQVWDCGNMLPNKNYEIIVIPGQGQPRTPSLAEMTSLAVQVNAPDQLIPADQTVEVQVTLQNNANQAVTSELAAKIVAGKDVLLENSKPFTCPPHQSATVAWPVTPPAPGFYTITASLDLNGVVKRVSTNFGYAVAALTPVTQHPADYTDYWNKVVAQAKAVEVKLTRLEERARSTGTVTVYRIGIEADGVTCFGWLSVPKYPGKYPGLLLIPGDRVRSLQPNAALADCGFVIMTIEPTGQSVDTSIKPLITQISANFEDPATVGLRNVYVRYLRAITALASVPEVDANRLAVTGVGLGGGMSLVLAALDERIQAVAPDVPYYCDIERGKDAGDWPYQEIAAYLRERKDQADTIWQTLRYYDAANAAESVTCPVLISAGINDPLSRPANIYAVFNRLGGPHDMKLYLAGHEGGGIKHWEEKMRWLGQVLGGPSPVPPAPAPAAAPAAAVPAPGTEAGKP